MHARPLPVPRAKAQNAGCIVAARTQGIVMAKGQMRSNKEKKKPKADKNQKKGGPAPSPFTQGQGQPGSNPYGKKGS
jgi:hypothetical protein